MYRYKLALLIAMSCIRCGSSIENEYETRQAIDSTSLKLIDDTMEWCKDHPEIVSEMRRRRKIYESSYQRPVKRDGKELQR